MNMENKDKIKEVLKVLSDKLKEPQNKELLDGLLYELSPLCATGERRLDDIYELCIEKIIRDQAIAFYKDTPLAEIRSQLVDDFIRMEYYRRKDDFGNFCLALYQQIECMTNYVCRSPQLHDIVSKMWGYQAWVKSGIGVKISISEREGEYTIGKLVLIGDNKVEKSKMALQNLYAIDKIRTIVYFYGYRAMMKNSDYDSFIEITSLLNDIYQCRNLVHRGNVPDQWEQGILDRVLPLQSFYYYKFLGVLAQYVSYIKDGLAFLPSLVMYANSIEKKELKPQVNIKAEANTKKYEGKYNGLIVSVKSGEFEVKIGEKRYVVKRKIKDGINKGDNVEIDGYEIVYGNYISINQYTKV